MIKAIAWDIDGTLIDSEPMHYKALVQVCTELDIDIAMFDEHEFIGVHMEDVWQAILPYVPTGVTYSIWLAQINEYYIAHWDALTPVSGAKEVVTNIANLGIQQVCVSNSCREVVDANLKALGVGHLIQFSLSLNDVARGKPDPLPYIQASQKLGISTDQVLIIEDSHSGIVSGFQSGGRVVQLRSASFDAHQNARYHVEELSSILTIIQEVNHGGDHAVSN
ncbi:HAD family phosphatase [Vibrio sp. S9_S30]|uniref:HAD family hydrolase n=1 Tax=Vibrio sp. S9_S30 TaxID=2720226 RepID=UPI001680B58E|nr:HAD family phosphatase [Vibrio sp. S9_S30]MBD1558194.1 HAD family phosphatase [Vibrio sp. S9_S30]